MGDQFRTAAKAAAASDEDDDVGDGTPDPNTHVEFYLEPDGSVTQAREASAEAEGPFYSVYPDETQLALFSGAFADDTKMVNIVGETIAFLRAVLTPFNGGWPRLKERMYDQKDLVDIETLQAVIERVFEEVAGRPTPPSSGSTSSRASGGRRSTGSSRAATSTRSRSPRVGSAT